jgi:NodT family efflux transporter outer membrane factor (OMF) lipoprotein
MTSITRFAACSAIAIWSLSACAIRPLPDPMPIETPAAYSTSITAVPTDSAAQQSDWWLALKDEDLDKIMATAMNRGLSLQAAEAQIAQARAGLGQATANLLPSAVLSSSALRVGSKSASAPAYSASFDSSWEIPLFGGSLLARKSKQAGLRAVEANYFATRVSLAAQIAQTYDSVRSLQDSIAIQQRQIKAQQKIHDIVAARLEYGAASKLDMARADSQLAAAESPLPGLQTQLASTQNQLAVLAGLPPGGFNAEFAAQKPVPIFADLPAAGTPEDLLSRRPDIIAALSQLEASEANTAVARSQYFPQITLNASLSDPGAGAQGQVRSLSDLLDGRFVGFSIGPSLSWKILDFGQLNAAIDQAKGAERAALVSYKKTLLQALLDVENALVGVNNGKAALDLAKEALTAAQSAAEISRGEYLDGAIDLSDLLTVEAGLASSESAFAEAQLTYATAQIAYVKAIGGGW